MGYYCTRCEFDKLPHETRRQTKNSKWVTVLYCHLCSSNTDHLPLGVDDE